MTLRLRAALLVASACVLTAGLVAGLSYLAVARQLREETDLALRAAATQVGGRPLAPPTGSLDDLGPGSFPIQRLNQAGDLVWSNSSTVLDISQSDRLVASGNAPDLYSNREQAGVHYRVLTMHSGPGPRPRQGAVMVARDQSETQRVLSGLARRSALLAALVAFFGAAVAFLLTKSVTRPLEQLTSAVEQVATGDLSASVPDSQGHSEVARLARSFNATTEALALSRAEQRRLAQDAGHELRTPLTSLRTNLSVLSHPGLTEQDRDEIVADLLDESKELSSLVEELVALAAGVETNEQVSEIDLCELVLSVAAKTARRTHMDLKTVVVPDESLHNFQGQRQGLERLVTNLCTNAAKFAPGSLLTVKLETVDNNAVLSVSDQGPGFGPDPLRYFGRFVRADTARALPGSGLGLSIVADVVARHQGRVFAFDHQDKGATVGCVLPLDPVRHAATKSGR